MCLLFVMKGAEPMWPQLVQCDNNAQFIQGTKLGIGHILLPCGIPVREYQNETVSVYN